MIEKHCDDNRVQLILAPNKSMSWSDNKKILMALFVVNLTIGSVWVFMGAWMVLPFAGLEVLCVGAGMYYVSWKLNFKHIITVEAESVILQKGVYFPKQQWQWQRAQTRLLRIPSQYRMSAPTLQFKHLNENVEIGEFLNRGEKKQLVETLQKLGFQTHLVKS